MSAQITTPEETVTHLTADLIGKLASAYGDTDKALCARVLAVRAALAYGVDVKTIAADMADANRANSAIPAVSPQTLGQANFALKVADMIGTDVRAWIKRDPKAVADTVRAAHPRNGGIKANMTAIRDALKPIDTSKVFEREEIAVGIITSALERVLPEPAESTPRGPAAGGTSGSEDSETSGAASAPRETVSEDMSARAALATVRALTAWLTTGNGSWSPDLESALAELRSAATDARKRGQHETARLKSASVETVAA
jgi:hypothetical protein